MNIDVDAPVQITQEELGQILASGPTRTVPLTLDAGVWSIVTDDREARWALAVLSRIRAAKVDEIHQSVGYETEEAISVRANRVVGAVQDQLYQRYYDTLVNRMPVDDAQTRIIADAVAIAAAAVEAYRQAL